MDLGPWLVSRDVTVVSTVPTLAALWPAEALEAVRLLIFGGEACPPELAARLAVEGREVWNTYGPTEATVVACAARLDGVGPVRIGLPLAGWDLAVVDSDGQPVGDGRVGELVIGGVGLARYLDEGKDAEKYAPMPALGWRRAYRSGDLVRLESEGLIFCGRADDQVKVGGRRIELGEVDAALVHLPGVSGGAAAVRRTAAGTPVLVGYVASADPEFDIAAARAQLAARLPAALVPRLVRLDELPTRTSGKVDRDALPWPPPGGGDAERTPELGGTAQWLAGLWRDLLGATVMGPEADFFALGGGSLAAAQLVSALRDRYPQVTVADLYDHPRLGSLAGFLNELDAPPEVVGRVVRPTPRPTQLAQIVLSVPLAALAALQWVTWLALGNNVARALHLVPWTVAVSWWLVVVAFIAFVTPLGRMAIAVLAARLLLPRVQPGIYRRGGWVHLRVWLAERLAEASGAENLAGAPWLVYYARALGAGIGKGVDLHSMPPVTGLLTLGHRSAVEPEVDLCGHWIDGDAFHVGAISIGNDATIGARTTLLPGAVVGKNADVAPGSGVVGKVKSRQYWKGSPAVKSGRVKHRARRTAGAQIPLGRGVRPDVDSARGYATDRNGGGARGDRTGGAAHPAAVGGGAARSAVVAGRGDGRLGGLAVMTVVAVRMLSIALREGYHPVRSRSGWQLWATERLMDGARTHLFPLYASLATPGWLRLLGAKVGRDTEISTVLLTPKFTIIEDGAFLADDTMVASYELGGGWIYAAKTTVGRRAFLGNSGITQPGRRVPDDGLVAVLSAAPAESQARFVLAGQPAHAAAPATRRGRFRAHLRATAAIEGDAGNRRGVSGAAGDGDRRDRAGGSGHAAGTGPHLRDLVRRAMRRAGAAGRGRCRRQHRGRREMASGRPDSGGRVPAVVAIRVAQRARRYVCGNRCGAVVCARGQRHTRHEHVAARTGSQGRSRCLV